MFVPGKGPSLGASIVVGTLGLAAIAGLAAGIGIESSEKAVQQSKLSKLQQEIDLAKDVQKEINIDLPEGKVFINK